LLDFSTREYVHVKGWLTNERANKLFEQYFSSFPWKQNEISLFGKKRPIPRLECYFGDEGLSYSYSGQKLQALSWNKELKMLKTKIEAFSGAKYNSCLCNLYRDGNDSNGWHSDDEKELGERPIIASLSLGFTRKFQIREKLKGSKIDNLHLAHGDLLIMGPKMQIKMKHCVPKEKRIESPRINLTFRLVKS
jgi:alkylated DNA repair dioxygenase AlkB